MLTFTGKIVSAFLPTHYVYWKACGRSTPTEERSRKVNLTKALFKEFFSLCVLEFDDMQLVVIYTSKTEMEKSLSKKWFNNGFF